MVIKRGILFIDWFTRSFPFRYLFRFFDHYMNLDKPFQRALEGIKRIVFMDEQFYVNEQILRAKLVVRTSKLHIWPFIETIRLSERR